jgi:HK97 family phage major capsid protein
MPPGLPAPPALPSSGFGGHLVPVDVQQRIIALIIEEAAFANSITRLPTSSGSVAFPTARPEGAAWLAELAQIPLMNLNDSAVVVAVAKIAGLIDIANEMLSDASINVTTQVTTLIRDSLSKQLDDGLLFGSGPPEPVGIVATAAEVSGADLLEAVLTARGSINDAGGAATTLAASGATLAAADGARDETGALLFPNGFAAVHGLTQVTVPDLSPALVYDRARLYLVLRDDPTVEVSADFRWDFDATSLRVKARMAAACPDPAKSLRKLAVAGAGPSGSGAPETPAKARAK